MFSKLLILTIFSVLNVWTFDIYLKGFPNWISANSLFNSFIIPANELESTNSKNSSSSGCVHLLSKEIETNEKVLSAMCYTDDPKCTSVTSSPLTNLRSIAPQSVCRLRGNLTNVTIILEPHDFIYILVEGCYYLNKIKQTDYIWSFTNNTYMKYSIADAINTNNSESISVKFINETNFFAEGSSCSNLCSALFCINRERQVQPSTNGPPMIDLNDLKVAKGSIIKSLYIFGIIAAVIASVGCLIYVFYKLYKKV